MEGKHYLKWVPRCRQLRAEGHDLEDVLRFLRDDGASVIDSMGVIMELESISLRRAKVLVFSSDVWKDVRDREDAFHEDVEKKTLEALRQLKYKSTCGNDGDA